MKLYTKQDKPRVVIDTNIAVSALIAKHGFPARLFEKILLDEVLNFTSEEILEEMTDVFNRKEITDRVLKESVEFVLTKYVQHSIKVNPKTKLQIAQDPDDNKFIETAIEAKAAFIISGDSHLLKISEFRGIKIITAKEFLRGKIQS